MEAHEGEWWRVEARDDTMRIVVAREWFDEDDFSQASRSKSVLSDGATCGLIGEAEAVVAARQWSLMYYSHDGSSGDADNDGCSG